MATCLKAGAIQALIPSVQVKQGTGRAQHELERPAPLITTKSWDTCSKNLPAPVPWEWSGMSAKGHRVRATNWLRLYFWGPASTPRPKQKARSCRGSQAKAILCKECSSLHTVTPWISMLLKWLEWGGVCDSACIADYICTTLCVPWSRAGALTNTQSRSERAAWGRCRCVWILSWNKNSNWDQSSLWR